MSSDASKLVLPAKTPALLIVELAHELGTTIFTEFEEDSGMAEPRGTPVLLPEGSYSAISNGFPPPVPQTDIADAMCF